MKLNTENYEYLKCPKILSLDIWKKLIRKYDLNLDIWNDFDCVKKIALLKGAHIDIPYNIIFGHNYSNKYPEDIYNYERSKRCVLDVTQLNGLRRAAIHERKEIGGIILFNEQSSNIKYKESKIEIKYLFVGNGNRIDLNVLDRKERIQCLFHTHPADDDVLYEPPSLLDIVSFLIVNIKSIADLIIDNKPVEEILKVETSGIFTKNEVYVIYFSENLLYEIVKYLFILNKKEDFVYEVEKLMEEVELYYALHLIRFNRILKNEEVDEYLNELNRLGLIVKRSDYLSSEFFIF